MGRPAAAKKPKTSKHTSSQFDPQRRERTDVGGDGGGGGGGGGGGSKEVGSIHNRRPDLGKRCDGRGRHQAEVGHEGREFGRDASVEVDVNLVAGRLEFRRGVAGAVRVVAAE